MLSFLYSFLVCLAFVGWLMGLVRVCWTLVKMACRHPRPYNACHPCTQVTRREVDTRPVRLDGPCQNEATRRYLQKTPTRALTRCTMMVAREAQHDWTHSSHIHN